jgi:hypothetical protein
MLGVGIDRPHAAYDALRKCPCVSQGVSNRVDVRANVEIRAAGGGSGSIGSEGRNRGGSGGVSSLGRGSLRFLVKFRSQPHTCKQTCSAVCSKDLTLPTNLRLADIARHHAQPERIFSDANSYQQAEFSLSPLGQPAAHIGPRRPKDQRAGQPADRERLDRHMYRDHARRGSIGSAFQW